MVEKSISGGKVKGACASFLSQKDDMASKGRKGRGGLWSFLNMQKSVKGGGNARGRRRMRRFFKQ